MTYNFINLENVMNIKNNNMVIRKSGVDYVTVTGFMYKDAVGVAIKLAKNAGIDCYQAAVMEGSSILTHTFRIITDNQAKEYNS